MTEQIKPGDIEVLFRFREMMGRFPVNDIPSPWADFPSKEETAPVGIPAHQEPKPNAEPE